MLKRRSLVLLLVVLMLAVPAIAAAASVSFGDDNLEAAVRKAMDFDPAKDISPQDMAKLLTKLNNDHFQGLSATKSLKGLEHASNLEELVISIAGPKVKDLTPIRNLKSLKLVDVTKNTELNYSPDDKQMKILQEIQNRGAVVLHDGPVKRISGDDRYKTAVRVFQNYVHENEVNTVILARGDDFADALAGGPYAAKINAPILLTTPNKLHKETKQALIDYLNDNAELEIIVLGGKDAISNAVVRELTFALESEFKGLDLEIDRIEGDNRYETAIKIAKALVGEGEGIDKAFIASGEDYADALASAYYGLPILLTKKAELPECVEEYLEELSNVDAVVVGGPEAVSAAVIKDLKDSGSNVTRVWGADRYKTAVELATEMDVTITNYVIATGENFADALTGAALSDNGQGVLLVKSNSIPSVVDDYVWDNRKTSGLTLTILGGESAVSLNNAVALYKLLP